MYRFRSVENLIGEYQELENQYIFFASPEQLNDPIEGYRDIFWSGDEIVWKNLLKNYITSLEYIFLLIIICDDKEKITEKNIRILNFASSKRTQESKNITKSICDDYFSNEFIKNFAHELSKRKTPVRRNELLSYFKFIHQFAINSISKIFFEKGLISQDIFSKNLNEFDLMIEQHGSIPYLMNRMEEENNDINIVEKFMLSTNFLSSSYDLQTKYEYSNNELLSNRFFLLIEFPEHFLSKLEESIYPPWYSASFLFEDTNSSIWGHYGDNHKGVCMKFKVTKEKKHFRLNLQTEYGYNSESIVGMRPQKFRKINYHAKHIAIDFFRSIGRLSKHELNHFWYSNENGEQSICGEHMNKNEAKWRDTYWNNFFKSISIKLTEWKYEKEYRLIVNEDFIDYTDKENRKLKYDFNDLESITFGIKTQTSDKIQIMKIIEEKCKKNSRKEFDFYQAYYSKETGKIEKQKLNILSIK